MSSSEAEALAFGKRALLMNGIYIGGFFTSYIPFVWKLLSPKPLNSLSKTGMGNSNIMLTTSLWLGMQNILCGKSNDYTTVKNTLYVNTFGFLMWFVCDLFHYKTLENAYTKLFYVGLVPITFSCMVHSYFAANKMVNAKKDN
eukprot:352494_1